MKSWKKRWEEELDAVIPALDKAIINEPIPVVERKKEEKKKPVASLVSWIKKLFATPRRVTAFATACAVALVAVGSSLYFGLSKPLTASAEVISVEINPQAVFSVDKKGKVTAVIASNADADVVLSENRDKEMEGKSVEEAVRIFVDYTARLGYLDLDDPDAVRITSCTKNGKLDEVGDTLETYFRENGLFVAIAEETVNVKDFCERANLAVKSNVKELKNNVESIPAMLFEREAAGKSIEELQESYDSMVTDLLKFKGLEKIEKRENDLAKIEENLDAITSHEDNPGGFFLRSYWDIKDNTDLSESLATLVADTTAKIAAYESAYSVTLDDGNAIFKEKVENLLDMTSALLSSTFENIFDMLSDLCVEVNETLMTIPDTVDSYITHMNNYMEESAHTLIEKFSDSYETVREEISKVDYESFINGLIAEYGSLSEYFNKK